MQTYLGGHSSTYSIKQNFKKASTNRSGGRNRWQYNHSRGLQLPTFSNGSSSREKIEKRSIELEPHFRPNVPNRHTESICPTIAERAFFSRMHGVLSCMDHMIGHKAVLANLRSLNSDHISFPITMV